MSKNRFMRRIFLFAALAVCVAASPTKKPEYELVVQSRHIHSASSIKWSPTGKFFVTGSRDDKTVKIWNDRGLIMRTLGGNSTGVSGVAISKDAQIIVSGSDDGSIRIWDHLGRLKTLIKGYTLSEQNDAKETLPGHSGLIQTLVFSPDDSMIATGADDRTVRLWTRDGTLIQILLHAPTDVDVGDVTSISFAPDGKYLATATRTMIRYWSITGQLIKTIPIPHGSNAVIFSPDGASIFAESCISNKDCFHGESKIFAWRLDGTAVRQIEGFPNRIIAMSFQPHSGSIVTVDTYGRIRKVDRNDKVTAENKIDEMYESSAAITPDGITVATSSEIGVKVTRLDPKLAEAESPSLIVDQISALAVSPDGDSLATGDFRTGRIRTWKQDTSYLKEFSGHSSGISCLQFSPDSKTLISGSWGNVNLWTVTGQLLDSFENSAQTEDIVFSPSGNFLSSLSNHGWLKVWNIHTKELTYSAQDRLDESMALAYLDENKLALRAAHSLTFRNTQRMETNEEVIPLYKVGGFYSADATLAISKQLGIFAVSGDSGEIKVVSLAGEPIKTYVGHTQKVTKLLIAEREQAIISASRDNEIRSWSLRTGSSIEFRGHSDIVTSIGTNLVDDKLFSASADGTVNIWSLSTAHRHASLLASGPDWLVYTPDGYWDASPNGGRLVAMVKGLEAFGVDQFAIRNNRPDIILQRLGSKDQARIDHFHDLYQARLRKFGINEADLSGELHAPEAKILDTKTEGKFAEVKFALSDSKYDLHSYNIFVNDVPLFATGKKVSGKAGTITEKIELTSGENKIEVSVLNSKYVESIRALTFASYQPKEPVKGDLYFIGFGVSKYQNSKFDLKYAASDADNMEKTLLKMKGKGYREVHAHVYRDKHVTQKTIRAAKKLLANAKPDDTFVLFISGHGKHDTDKGATYYYLTHNADLNNLAGTAAKFELIEDLLHGIGPRQKIFLMDTCESGETDEGSTQKYLAWAAARKAKGVHARAIPTARGLTTSEAPKSVRSYLHERDRFIYNDLMRRSGAIVFSSSRGGEFSYEDDALKAGYFTRAILDGLAGAADANKDGKIAIDELKQYTSKTVQEWSDGLQNPTVDRDNIYQKIVLPVVR